MRKRDILIFSFSMVFLLVSACTTNQSLQEYFVENAENPNFISLDVPSSMLPLINEHLHTAQEKALQSVNKVNVLAFKKNVENEREFTVQKQQVSAILANSKFTELIKLNTPYGKGVVKFLGTEDAIDEVIIYGSRDDMGFALIRILGNDMDAASIASLVQAAQQATFKGDGLPQLGAFFNAK
ncbi:DUF4252 domain-containing protein [Arenibacter sp. GZD96]|uniref:DUF4252 domain-containing protein n=1 Tax=Aurantibrevibacter litoralis TaxID=3106030 RepID=UPI002AFF482D|nr:DUF4252 domain-containing protein [Arenibacter sp. GZD-96]MEA1786901.1 DUF4252 domain-containing protein [Arenibacter sp. GZD-96]